MEQEVKRDLGPFLRDSTSRGFIKKVSSQKSDLVQTRISSGSQGINPSHSKGQSTETWGGNAEHPKSKSKITEQQS